MVLLLAACGGSSSSNSAAGSGSGSAPASSGSSGSAASATATATAAATATKSGKATSPASAKAHHSVAPQPSSGTVTFPSVGTTILVVQHSALGFVLAQANGQVLYTYAKDTNGVPTCTGSCASTWPPATGTPQAGPADHFPGTFTLVKGAGGVGQIAYNGHPLYLFKGAKPLSTAGNGIGGLWHVVPLSASDISGA